MSLAHQILKLKNTSDVDLLKEKAKEVYEKASVLSFLHRYNNETVTENRDIETLVDDVFKEEKVVEKTEEISTPEKTKETPTGINSDENPTIFDHIEETSSDLPNESTNTIAIEEVPDLTDIEDFKESVSLDVTSELFENATRVNTVKTINDIANKQNLQLDLNDRIAFVKHLFNENKEDFNRVISQLNTMPTEKEAKAFLDMVKKDYNWSDKQEYEERLVQLVERKFL